MGEVRDELLKILADYLSANAGGTANHGAIYAAVIHSLRVGAPGLSENTREVIAHNAARKALFLLESRPDDK